MTGAGRRRGEEAPETAPIPIPVAEEEPETAPIRSSSPASKPRPRSTKQLPEDLIDGYLLEQWLGEGAMGAVFRGRQLSLDRPVAIKILTPKIAANESFLKRFNREARAVARLNHPNVVSGIDVGESKGYRYFVMEFVEGPTLQQMLNEEEALEPERATRIILQVAKALNHAHRNSLVHRDVKPANIIIVAKTGVAKLCDLGLAKEVDADGSDTLEGRAMGTPYYISPEQARGDPDIDIRSDLYSLGATFFHAVNGTTPFDGPTPAVIMTKHLTEPIPPVFKALKKANMGVAAIIKKMLAKDPDDRHQTPAELIDDLEDVLEGRYKPEQPQIRSRRRRRRFR